MTRTKTEPTRQAGLPTDPALVAGEDTVAGPSNRPATRRRGAAPAVGRRLTIGLGHAAALAAALVGLCTVAHAAPSYRVIYSFSGTDGAGPYGGVTLGQKGGLYGTTAGGGSGGCSCGTVFRLTPLASSGWVETVLYNFLGKDGGDPHGNVLFDASGNLYGTTAKGGAYDQGTVFELAPDSGGWTETLLLDFNGDDGAAPNAGLVINKAGNLYGTAPGGGIDRGGVAFELTPGSSGWSESELHGFHYSYYGHPAPGGSNPYGGVILDASGNLYGTTYDGGADCGSSSCGTVYELTPAAGSGWREIVLHRFHNNGKDGFNPGNGALIMDSSGSLYGTTVTGGCCG
jgi:uncharacterized repeat protein (TIGR03803 family)